MALHLRYHHKISKNRAPSFVFVSKVQIHRTEHLCPEGTKGLQRVHAGAYSAGESATTVPTATTDVATADGTGCLKPHINLQAAPSTVPWKSAAAATGWGYCCKISTEQLQALLTAGPCAMGGSKEGVGVARSNAKTPAGRSPGVGRPDMENTSTRLTSFACLDNAVGCDN